MCYLLCSSSVIWAAGGAWGEHSWAACSVPWEQGQLTGWETLSWARLRPWTSEDHFRGTSLLSCPQGTCFTGDPKSMPVSGEWRQRKALLKSGRLFSTKCQGESGYPTLFPLLFMPTIGYILQMILTVHSSWKRKFFSTSLAVSPHSEWDVLA